MKLRKLDIRDIDYIYEWMQDDSVTCGLRKKFRDFTKDDIKDFVLNSHIDCDNIHLGIIVDDIYMGTISLKNIKDGSAEYAIVLRKCAFNKGYGYQASKLLFEYAKGVGIYSIYLNVYSDNISANKLYKSLGMVYYDSSSIIVDNIKRELYWYKIVL